MSNRKIIGLFILTAGVWYGYQKYNFSQKVSFKIVGISIDGGLFDPQIILSIALNNPTQTITTISNLTAELFLNGNNKIADVYFFGRKEISANSQTILPLAITPTLATLINTIKQVLIVKKGTFDLKGNATIDGLNIPFSLNYQLS
jgi:LEA14-like dessication related protein